MSQASVTPLRRRRAGAAAADRAARRRAAVFCLAALALTGTASSARAHGTPVALSVWGNFNRTAAICQREIGRGAAQCGLRAWEVRRNCQLRQLAGEACDEDADDRSIDAARRQAFDSVRPRCSPIDLSFLQFRDLFDVQTDMVNFCRDLEDAAVSVVFNPLFTAPEEGLDPAARACVTAFAAVTTKALRAALRTHETTLDRIAARSKAPAAKRRDIDLAHVEVDTVMEQLRGALAVQCSEAQFQATYGHPLPDLIELVSTRADCLAAAAYPVDAFTCPLAVCGNGMNERAESCDDGNLADGDGCDAACRRE